MSAQSFTPGPWSLSTVETSCGSCHKIGPFPGAGHRPEVYACVYADGIRIGIDEKLPAAEELLANARLMVAAPDLLKALQTFIDKYDSAPDGDLGVGLTNGDFFAARAAIAKAKGLCSVGKQKGGEV